MPSSYRDDMELTADQAKDYLGITTRAGVIAMIDRGELPGARKLEPDKPTSPWLIPWKSIRKHPNFTDPQKQRGQSGED